MVIRNTGHIGSAVEFKINNHDPFEYPYYFDNRFATREPEMIMKHGGMQHLLMKKLYNY